MLSHSFVPGVNIKRAVAGADWIFLRPAVATARMICLGLPPASSLPTLAAFCGTVHVIVSQRDLPAAREATAAHPGMSVLAWTPGAHLPVPSRVADTLYVASASGWRLLGAAALQRELQRVLHPAALVYGEQFGIDGLTPVPEAWPFAGAQRVRLSPLLGEARLAVPEHDAEMRAYVKRHGLGGGLLAGTRWERAAAVLAGRVRSLRREPSCGTQCGRGSPARAARGGGFSAPGRYGVFAGAAAAGDGPPRYLREIAAANGVVLDGYRWAFRTSADYASRKMLFHLKAPRPGGADYIVKMVRAASFNPRLENEFRVLRLLARSPAPADGSIPQAAFIGHHAGLAIVGETLIDAAPFTERSCLAPDCRYLRAALAALTRLAADRDNGRASGAGGAMARLYSQFCDFYSPHHDERRFLAARLDVLQAMMPRLPAVVQHGDAGVWNMLARPDGSVALIDWEAADTEGVPLWDLCYFLRTYAVAAHRARGGRGHLPAVNEIFVSSSRLHAAAVAAFQAYRERLTIPQEVIEPLFYLCWMHRAVKEASRLPASRLPASRYLAVLRLLIASRRRPALCQLLLD
jgi:aminoglycoside phosphotransferase (APT) family kinase protein